jgi:PIN domain nuclease of toxin-antitoxin system
MSHCLVKICNILLPSTHALTGATLEEPKTGPEARQNSYSNRESMFLSAPALWRFKVYHTLAESPSSKLGRKEKSIATPDSST